MKIELIDNPEKGLIDFLGQKMILINKTGKENSKYQSESKLVISMVKLLLVLQADALDIPFY